MEIGSILIMLSLEYSNPTLEEYWPFFAPLPRGHLIVQKFHHHKYLFMYIFCIRAIVVVRWSKLASKPNRFGPSTVLDSDKEGGFEISTPNNVVD